MKKDNIKVLIVKTIHQPTIDKLQHMLDLAKEGVVQSIAMATVDAGGYTSSFFEMAPGASDFAMVGSLDYCKQRLLRQIEGRE